jgi:hypothetical protein
MLEIFQTVLTKNAKKKAPYDAFSLGWVFF